MNIVFPVLVAVSMLHFPSSPPRSAHIPQNIAQSYTLVIIDDEEYPCLLVDPAYNSGTVDTNCDGYLSADGLWNQQTAIAEFGPNTGDHAYTEADHQIFFMYVDPLEQSGDTFEGPNTISGSGKVNASGKSSDSSIEAASEASLGSLLHAEDGAILNTYNTTDTEEVTLYKSYLPVLIGEDIYWVASYGYFSSQWAHLDRCSASK